MKYLTSAEIREKYLSFFEEKGCKRWPSSSLIPDDPSLLLTSAGMVQFKPYFLQQKHLEAPYIGTTTVQKCVRTNDIDIIGTTGRHQSFFEMLGNFSFGAYFKKEMCAWALEFSTEVLGLPAERLYFTVYLDDDETIEIWKSLGVPDDHISRLGEEDNFWRAGPTGPCGPCSEIYYDQGPEFGCGSPDCAPGCDCDRFLEYWNLVFTQYDGQEDGTFVPLPKKNIDTGMGLERIAAILQGVQSNYETDVLRSLISVGERLCGATYGKDPAADLSLRIMADHSRAVAFMIADGILPSNEGRGLRAAPAFAPRRHEGPSAGAGQAVPQRVRGRDREPHGHVYPEIVENRELMRRVILSEEERFGATLRQGRAFLDEALAALDGEVLPASKRSRCTTRTASPWRSRESCAGSAASRWTWRASRAAWTSSASAPRAANTKDAEAAWSTYGGVHAELLEELGPTAFVGYEALETEARVTAIVKDGARVQALSAGETGEVVLDATPFYAEMGGEVGDTGTLRNACGVAEVRDAQAPEKGLVAHKVTMTEGSLSVGDAVTATVDAERRARITRNHTATHILHAALRQVLGDHVKQAGSYVGPDRLRFDFTHFEALTPEQLAEVERVANEHIMKAVPTAIYETSLDAAREAGVTALFGEKYGDVVRVVEAGRLLARAVRRLPCGQHGRDRLREDRERIERGREPAPHRGGDQLRRAGVREQPRGRAEGGGRNVEVPPAGGGRPCGGEPESIQRLAGQEQAQRPGGCGRRHGGAAGGCRHGEGRLSRRHRAHGRGRCGADAQRVGRPARAPWRTRRGGARGREGRQAHPAGRRHAGGGGGGLRAGAVIKAIASCVKGGGGGKPAMAQAGGKDASGIDAALEAARELLA